VAGKKPLDMIMDFLCLFRNHYSQLVCAVEWQSSSGRRRTSGLDKFCSYPQLLDLNRFLDLNKTSLTTSRSPFDILI